MDPVRNLAENDLSVVYRLGFKKNGLNQKFYLRSF